MMPRPPWRAMAIAIRDSVTVSMADETNGIRNEIELVNRLVVSTSLGTTSLASGKSNTSSKVSPKPTTFSSSFTIALSQLLPNPTGKEESPGLAH